MTTVQIILPKRTIDALGEGLCDITEAIGKLAPDSVAHGFLGGMNGYGAHYENDVFTMRPFYWGDCDCGAEEREADWAEDHRHKPDCYQSALREEKKAAGLWYWDEETHEGIEETSKFPSHDAKSAAKDAIYKKLCSRFGLSYPSGCAVHCTCGHDVEWDAFISSGGGHKPTCALELPNFRHKASGFEVRWYKYIGRDMETTGTVEVKPMLQECLASIKPKPA